MRHRRTNRGCGCRDLLVGLSNSGNGLTGLSFVSRRLSTPISSSALHFGVVLETLGSSVTAHQRFHAPVVDETPPPALLIAFAFFDAPYLV
jgi:hypothetical protein